LSTFTLNHGSRESKKIAITMDDVYETEWVWKAVELCRQYGITMTFFPIGINLKEEDRENWQAVLDAGCEIGSHSMNHLNFRDIGEYVAIERLGRFQERLDRVLGYHYEVRWFRPPTGSITDKNGSSTVMVRAIRTYGYDHIVRWDVSQTDPAKAIEKVQNGSILLYHARHKDYVCLETLIPMLLEAGFEPVTVSELYGFPPPETSEELYVYDIHKIIGK
jgi:peptidoglycan/xylan/chitin deacetylase (PgdA/CDA1 family)